MIKNDHIREYATEAFRYYAAQGKPTYEQLKRQIYDEILEKEKRELVRAKGITDPTANAHINAEKEVERRTPELLDILAVESTIELLRRYEKYEIVKCIENVYFPEPKRPLKSNEISARVNSAALSIPCSDRQVYRLLKQARMLFAAERGLRI